MTYDDDVVTVLSHEECWDLLREAEFGRLAFRMSGGMLSFTDLLHRIDDVWIESDKLLGVVMHPDVVFEIDDYDERSAHSVVLRGIARRLEEDEEHRADEIGLRPWLGTVKYNVVEIRPTSVSGRAFRLEH